jgi:hypothetical protein
MHDFHAARIDAHEQVVGYRADARKLILEQDGDGPGLGPERIAFGESGMSHEISFPAMKENYAIRVQGIGWRQAFRGASYTSPRKMAE